MPATRWRRRKRRSIPRGGLAQAQSGIAGVDVAHNPDVLAAEAQLRAAAIALAHMKIVAPVDGVIAQRTVQVGQRVNAGAPLMAVVPLSNIWVDANFKEGQLSGMRIGQPVKITTDLYGGKVTFHGHVAGLGAGSGSAFALLPPQNASGNWIKIVQRVPVRIALDPTELTDNRCASASASVPMSMSATSRAPCDQRACYRRDARQYRRRHQRRSGCAGGQDIGRQWCAGAVSGAAETPLRGTALAVTAFALAMGTFMQVLDTTIANVSLPTIAGNLGASTDQSTWIITSFVVANGIGVPITGWLMKRYGV